MKEATWVGSSLKDLKALPAIVRRNLGFAIQIAQEGGQHPKAKPLKGFGSAGVVEVVEDHAGNTYRGVYTVKFRNAVYILHVFQKKSKKGIATPKKDMEMIRARLALAQAQYKEEHG